MTNLHLRQIARLQQQLHCRTYLYLQSLQSRHTVVQVSNRQINDHACNLGWKLLSNQLSHIAEDQSTNQLLFLLLVRLHKLIAHKQIHDLVAILLTLCHDWLHLHIQGLWHANHHIRSLWNWHRQLLWTHHRHHMWGVSHFLLRSLLLWVAHLLRNLSVCLLIVGSLLTLTIGDSCLTGLTNRNSTKRIWHSHSTSLILELAH